MPMNNRLLRPRASGSFIPKSLPGLEAWYDSADSLSVTLDSGRVAEWRDKSGNARHASNSSSGSTQPTYVIAGQNGRNLVRFAASSSQRLEIANSTAAFKFLHDGTKSYVAAVASFGTTANPSAFYALFGNTGGSANETGILVGYDDRGAANDRLWCTVGSATTFVIASNTAGNDGFFTPQTTLVAEFLLDASNATAAQRLTARRNGGSAFNTNLAAQTPSTGNALRNMSLGSSLAPTASLFLQGDICEIIMYSQHPSEANQTAIRKYLAAKWGVTLA